MVYFRKPHYMSLRDLERIARAVRHEAVGRGAVDVLINVLSTMFGVLGTIPGLLEQAFRAIVTFMFDYSASTMEEIQKELGWKRR